MRKAVGTCAIVLSSCVAIGLGAVRETARGDYPEKVAVARVAPYVIAWEPLIEYESVALTVSGGGRLVFSGTFPYGAPLVFEFYDETGKALPDGVYKYELRASPRLSPEFKAAMTDARESGQDAAIEEALRKAGVVAENFVQSGAFVLVNGKALDPDEPEPGTPGEQSGVRKVVAADQGVAPQVVLTNGDGVIRNSLCVGFDCPDSPLFDDSTILLMENNTRIKFGDTSNSPFPANDWEIEANSNLSGGQSYIGFNDCGAGDDDGGCAADLVFAVEAGARASALYVESDGDIGIGTSSPALDLHIVTGNTPALRLDQDGSSGFTAQIWDIGGNEANFFVRDVTGGSRLPLRIRPTAPTSSIDIAGSGNVGLGTAAPSAALHVLRNNDPATGLRVENTEATKDTSARSMMKLANNGALRFDLTNTGDNHEWTFSVFNNGNFVISKSGTGVSEMLITPAGAATFQGTLTAPSASAGVKSFKIDHPLDPQNKFLSHSSVESPDMMNLYNGNVELDENGEAWIQLPDWFEALNRDFRYQLTAIGQSNPGLYVASQVADNRFKIAGGTPRSTVSWLVSGIRHDRMADAHRVLVEEEKPLEERGTFLHPELYTDVFGQRAAVQESETDPVKVVAAKNEEILRLSLENQTLFNQLKALTERIDALEKTAKKTADE